MKKGDIKTLTKILLIFLITIIILLGGGRLIWDAGRSALNIFNLINISETDYSSLNNEAKSSFNALINDIKNCQKYGKDNCYCRTSLSGFEDSHKLEITSEKIQLINTLNNNLVTMLKEDVKNINCYYDGILKDESKINIEFDEEFPRIDLIGDVYFNYDSGIYKKNNKLCLITKNFDLQKINKCES